MGYEAGINIFLIEVKIFQKSFFLKRHAIDKHHDIQNEMYANYLILKHIVRQMYNLDLDVFYFTSRS